jgi:hypothetical protein
MILKQREDRATSIATLEALMARPEARRHDIERLRAEIDSIIRGDMSESKAAYVLDVELGASRNWAIIHDLRITVDGLSAQIDHLLVNRFLEFWVLESKRMAGGIKVLDNGECLTFSGSRPIAIESPIEQNRRHVKVLQRLIDSGALNLPSRLGRTMKPRLESVVLISDGRISRPQAAVPGLESLIRTENFINHRDAVFDKRNSLQLARLTSFDTMMDMANQLVALHRPIEYDWERRFKLARPSAAAPALPQAAVEPSPPPLASDPPAANVAAIKPAAAPRPSAGQCDACQAPVSRGVKAYCDGNPERFGQRILCMPCQGVKARATG